MSVINDFKEKGFAKINYEKVKKYRVGESNNKKRYTLVFFLIGIILILVFPVDFKIKLLLSIIFSIMIYITEMNVSSKVKKQYWDGTIYSKRIENLVYYKKDGYKKQKVYIIEVKKENGKIVKYQFNDRKDIYDYYKVGEAVRHHKGFDLLEKFDKSKSKFILCLACLKLNGKKNAVCQKCKCKLFK